MHRVRSDVAAKIGAEGRLDCASAGEPHAPMFLVRMAADTVSGVEEVFTALHGLGILWLRGTTQNTRTGRLLRPTSCKHRQDHDRSDCARQPSLRFPHALTSSHHAMRSSGCVSPASIFTACPMYMSDIVGRRAKVMSNSRFRPLGPRPAIGPTSNPLRRSIA